MTVRFMVRFVVWSTAGAVIALSIIFGVAYVMSQSEASPVPHMHELRGERQVGDQVLIWGELHTWDGAEWNGVSDCPLHLNDIQCGA